MGERSPLHPKVPKLCFLSIPINSLLVGDEIPPNAGGRISVWRGPARGQGDHKAGGVSSQNLDAHIGPVVDREHNRALSKRFAVLGILVQGYDGLVVSLARGDGHVNDAIKGIKQKRIIMLFVKVLEEALRKHHRFSEIIVLWDKWTISLVL